MFLLLINFQINPKQEINTQLFSTILLNHFSTFDWIIQPRAQNLLPGLWGGKRVTAQAREKVLGTRLCPLPLVLDDLFLLILAEENSFGDTEISGTFHPKNNLI